MSRNTKSLIVATRWLGRVAWLLAGVVGAWLLLFDPLNVHPIDSWVMARAGFHRGHVEPAPESAEKQLWTCGMHPHVIQDEPGSCPICHMDLVPLGAPPAEASTGEPLFYRHPMNPEVTSPVPAQDEMGMDYVPVFADGAGGSGEEGVRIDPLVVQNMNVRSEVVTRGDLERRIRTVGYLEYDQERMVTVTTKYSGWVERVYTNYVGERVKRGQRLFEIYSPELVQTEQELLSALDYARKLASAPEDARRRAEGLVMAARTRLSYWDIHPHQVEELERSGRIFRTLEVVAPAGGVIMKRLESLEGMAVRPGMEIFHIADLRSLWLSVEIFEDQVAWIGEGTPAEIEFTYFPGETFGGAVAFIDPEFSEKTRTLKVKIEVKNRDGRLRPGMFATVVFRPVTSPQTLTVPSMAVLRTGERNVVVVELEPGRFSPRQVTLGREGSGQTEVLSGLEEGDRVVTSSQFLLDSEASLQEAVQKMLVQRQPGSEG